MGLDIFGLDILGLDILGLDILGTPRNTIACSHGIAALHVVILLTAMLFAVFAWKHYISGSCTR